MLARSAAEHGYELLGLEVMPNHVHIFLAAPPAVSPAVMAKVLKGAIARRLFMVFPHLKRELWGAPPMEPVLVGTAGHVNAENQALDRGAEDRCRC